MLDINFIFDIAPRLIQPLWITLAVSLLSLLLGTLIGVSLGMIWVLSSARSFLRVLLNAYVWIVRGTPIIIQIYTAFFVLPKLGMKLDVFWVGVVALTFNSAGYQIEIVRAAITSISRGQHEAAASIGMTNRMTMVWIVLPQAARRMIPPLANELANLVKASSVLSVISLFELTKAGDAIIAATFKFAEVLLVLSVLYFAIIQTLCLGAKYLEDKVFNFGNELVPVSSLSNPSG
ncbi:amino acid ABC transporter permease [Phormidium tenue FACHB-886]|nr:amino acid ABC transporter permease [Phormidium tenue FACHB-886]